MLVTHSSLCDPMDCSLPVSSVHGISQAKILEWVVISFSRGSSWPRDQTCQSWIGFFTTETPGKPILSNKKEQITSTGSNYVDESQKRWIRYRRQQTVSHHSFDILAKTKYRNRKEASDCHGLGAGWGDGLWKHFLFWLRGWFCDCVCLSKFAWLCT